MTVPRLIRCYGCEAEYVLTLERCPVCDHATSASAGMELGPGGHRQPGFGLVFLAVSVIWIMGLVYACHGPL